jgi:hypothetical protein
MANAIEWQDGTFTALDDDDPWSNDPTVIIPLEQLERLRDVMDEGDGAITQRLDPIPELLAAGSATELPMTPMCAEVSGAPRARERSVTIAPAAERHRAWLIALALVFLAVEILALSW